MQSRFGLPLSNHCTCDEICTDEFAAYGTSQSYDSSSYTTIDEIVLREGYTADTPAYSERYEELKEEAMADCIEACGACGDYPAFTLGGSTGVTAPGAYQYTAESQMTPMTWEVSGTGVSVSDDGMVTLAAEACGTFTVTATDSCGKTASLDVRVTNNGQWVSEGSTSCAAPSCPGCTTSGDVPAFDCAGYMAYATQYVGVKKYSLFFDSACCTRPATCTGVTCVAGVTTMVTNNDDHSCDSWCNPGATYIYASSVTTYRWDC
jgi:hypothetical protein